MVPTMSPSLPTSPLTLTHSSAQTENAFRLDCGGVIPFTRFPADDTTAITHTLTPDTDLPQGESCTLTITAAQVRSAGGTLPNDITRTFRIAPQPMLKFYS